MRKYFLPVVRYVAKSLTQPSVAQVNIKKNRAFAAAMAVSLLILMTTSIVAARTTAGSDGATQDAVTRQNHTPGSSVTATMTTMDTTPAMSGSTGTASTKMTFTANGRRVDVPDKGSYSKTFTNDKGATQIYVSHDSATTSDSTNGVSASTYITVQSDSVTNDVQVYSP